MTWENVTALLKAVGAFIISLFTGKKAVDEKATEEVKTVVENQNAVSQSVSDQMSQAQIDAPKTLNTLLERVDDHTA